MIPHVDVREHASHMLEQHLRSTFVGRRMQTRDLHGPGDAKPVLHGRDAE